MANNYIKARGTNDSWKPNKGGSINVPYPVIGVVKNNIDAGKSGTLQVYIADFGGVDPNYSKNWTPVHYVSPFFGITIPEASNQGEGDWTVNPNSYGMWATAPDIGTEVLCIFVNGQQDFGYYIGCLPKTSTTFMVPAVAATAHNIVANNKAQSEALSGANKLPVTETNTNDYAKDDSDPSVVSRPVHGYVASRLVTQGLIRDEIRGTISSSSMRESPSKVFGMSTPGKAIRKESSNPNKSDIHHRVGGHSFVMDDGDKDDKNCLIRLRTSLGHQITMSDDGETLFVIHANGQSYIELGKEGTVDIFSTNSFNVRTQGDINFHADRDINLHAKKKLNIRAEEVNLTSDKNTNQRVGENFKMQTIGDHTLMVDKGVSIESKADASFASSASTYVNGSKINLNTGSTSLKPKKVDELTMIIHSDTTGDDQKGYLSVPGTLTSITTRTPTHAPWDGHNQGVDVKVKSTNPATVAAMPSNQVAAVNNQAGSGASGFPVNQSITSTVPATAPVNDSIDKNTLAAVTAQRAADVSTQANTVVNGVKTNVDGTKSLSIGKLGQTPEELERAGDIKPGTSKLANALASQGKSIAECLPPNVFTGKNGVSDITSYMNNVSQQVATQVTGMKQGFIDLQNSGIITGKENGNQIAGIVSSTAQFGLPNIQNFINGTANNPNISSAISSGNYAANLADKSLNPSGALAGITGKPEILSAAQNAIQSILSSVKASLPTIPLNKPVNLDELNASSNNSNLLTTLKDKAVSIGSTLTSAIKKIGSQSTTLSTNNIPNMNDLTSQLNTNIMPNVNDLAKSLSQNLPSQDTLANLAGKSKELTASLSTIISSGPDKLKLPSVGADTFDNKSINSLATEITKVSSEVSKSVDFDGLKTTASGFANTVDKLKSTKPTTTTPPTTLG
jgi:hypothetical protein